jgi:ankyrin repeat protein
VKLSLRAFIKRTLPHLVKANQQDIVALVHQSFKDFLLQIKHLQFQGSQASNNFFIDLAQANCRVAADCLTYLALDDLWMVLPEVTPHRTFTIHNLKEIEKFVFAEYSMYQWSTHLQSIEDSQEVWIQFKHVLDNPRSWEVLCYNSENDMDYTLPLFQVYGQQVRFLIRRLVQAREDINKISKNGDTVLHRASLDNSSDIQFLLDLGADVNGIGERGQTMLHRLGLFRNQQRLLDWMERPGVNINAKPHDGTTILHIVVLWDWTIIGDILNILLGRQELNVNAMDTLGRTALTMAIHWGKEFATRILLNCPRVKMNTAGNDGENPLTNAASQCWTETLMFLLEGIGNIDELVDETGWTVLHWTVINNMIEPLQVILTSKSFLVNRPDNRMMAALHYAAEEGLPVITKFLLEKGAIPTVRNRLNETPFHLTAAKGNKWVIEALLEESPGASINDTDQFGWTPTHRAVTSGQSGTHEVSRQSPRRRYNSPRQTWPQCTRICCGL